MLRLRVKGGFWCGKYFYREWFLLINSNITWLKSVSFHYKIPLYISIKIFKHFEQQSTILVKVFYFKGYIRK